jgi:hypothetical protein
VTTATTKAVARAGLSRRAATVVAAAVATGVLSGGLALGAAHGWLGLDRVHVELRDRPAVGCTNPCGPKP